MFFLPGVIRRVDAPKFFLGQDLISGERREILMAQKLGHDRGRRPV
jgi:hypothetical protein